MWKELSKSLQCPFGRYVQKSFFLLCCAVWLMIAQTACNGSPVITPLPDPLFRLNTTTQAPNCDPKVGQPPCKWELTTTVVKVDVTDASDNPFQDCPNCIFSHKISMTDGNGTLHYLYYKLPNNAVIPLASGDNVKLTYIKGDHSNLGFAVSLINEKGGLIAAIASGPGGDLLKGLLGEFSVVVDAQKEAGREQSTCGTKVFRYTVFKTQADSKELAPGQTAKVKNDTGALFAVGNVNRYNWEASKCNQLRATPHSFFIHLTY